ncbi:phenylacetate-CoA ligase [Plasticicumulans lactativorans]|uniref:Phenylacetate-CoA ligase n=1 Tax=Plasticicumulans lactativorans TaxID=1133106 RepID=A0A4V2SCW0_9GAMM|nr:AMP-binding protein [Plasticicumulans lactativorans]TCO80830.1 phenylacetate-CoA ligase [Plasticicumulans lactativorans]
MSRFYDDRETAPAELREARLLAALPGQIAHAQRAAPALAEALAGVDAAAVTTRAALARLPVTRKGELAERQRARPPFGGYAAAGWGALGKVFQSPGPLYEPEGRRTDYWRFARALHAAGFRAGQLVHNAFSYHFTPAGSMFESGLLALGCTVFPAGTGQTELQLAAIADLRPDGYVGTPSFLRILLERAAETGTPVECLRRALVTGEALPPALRAAIEAHGVTVLQCYGTADLGLIAYETPAREGLVVDEELIVEIVTPGTGDPLPAGEVGEVVVTTLNPDYPLIRFGTGDLSAELPGTSPCGRTNRRLRGWLGRADQTTKVRGMFVHPGQVAAVLKRHPEAGRGRLVVDRDGLDDVMMLRVEAAGAPAGLAEALAASLRELTKLRGEVRLVAPDSLPRDGKVIDDRRQHG